MWAESAGGVGKRIILASAPGVGGKCWLPTDPVRTVPAMETNITTHHIDGVISSPRPPKSDTTAAAEAAYLEHTRDWWWGANHLEDMRLPIVGGLPQVRTLVRALDGDSWPWTTIGTAGDAWFQVLGTPETCTVELGSSSGAYRVAHAHRPDPSRHMLPPGCRWWARSCRADEIFTALTAASIGIRHLLRYPFRKNLVLHEIRRGRSGSRR